MCLIFFHLLIVITIHTRIGGWQVPDIVLNTRKGEKLSFFSVNIKFYRMNCYV